MNNLQERYKCTAKDKSDEDPAGQVAPYNCVEPLPLSFAWNEQGDHVSGWVEKTAAVKISTGVGGESH